MDIHIGEIESIVRAVDGETLLSPQVMSKIIQAVLQATRQQEEHHKRVRAEQRINDKVFDDPMQPMQER